MLKHLDPLSQGMNDFGDLSAMAFSGLEDVDTSKQPELGIALMDDEQKILFYLVARKSRQMGQDIVMSILTLLSDYASHHYLEEEAQMAEFGIPIDESHHQLHLEFRSMVSDLKGRAHMMKSDEILYDMKKLITEWLYDHIIRADFQYISQDRHGEAAFPTTSSSQNESTAFKMEVMR